MYDYIEDIIGSVSPDMSNYVQESGDPLKAIIWD